MTLPASHDLHSDDAADERRLAGAVRPEQTRHSARGDIEVEIVEHERPAALDAEAADQDRRHRLDQAELSADALESLERPLEVLLLERGRHLHADARRALGNDRESRSP